MTNNEIRQVLHNVSALSNCMDKEHLKKLLCTLTNAHSKKSGAFFFFIDIKKEIKKIISDLTKMDHVNNIINRRTMKQIYAIMGDYEFYPICKLCGQPIKISTYELKHEKQSDQMSFTWDHMKQKSQGGSYDMSNMQPTHKICNARRDTKPVYRTKHQKKGDKKYKITITLDFQVAPDMEHRYKPAHFGLRKQDSWCHKNRCCRCYGY